MNCIIIITTQNQVLNQTLKCNKESGYYVYTLKWHIKKQIPPLSEWRRTLHFWHIYQAFFWKTLHLPWGALTLIRWTSSYLTLSGNTVIFPPPIYNLLFIGYFNKHKINEWWKPKYVQWFTSNCTMYMLYSNDWNTNGIYCEWLIPFPSSNEGSLRTQQMIHDTNSFHSLVVLFKDIFCSTFYLMTWKMCAIIAPNVKNWIAIPSTKMNISIITVTEFYPGRLFHGFNIF